MAMIKLKGTLTMEDWGAVSVSSYVNKEGVYSVMVENPHWLHAKYQRRRIKVGTIMVTDSVRYKHLKQNIELSTLDLANITLAMSNFIPKSPEVPTNANTSSSTDDVVFPPFSPVSSYTS